MNITYTGAVALQSLASQLAEVSNATCDPDDLTPTEWQLVLLVRREVAQIVRLANGMQPAAAERYIAKAIDRFVGPLADVSEDLALLTASHVANEVRRLRLH